MTSHNLVVLGWFYLFLANILEKIRAQAKDELYCHWWFDDVFLPFVIKVFGCLHQWVNDFFYWYASMTWLTESLGDVFLSILQFISWWFNRKFKPPSSWSQLFQPSKPLSDLFFKFPTHLIVWFDSYNKWQVLEVFFEGNVSWMMFLSRKLFVQGSLALVYLGWVKSNFKS